MLDTPVEKEKPRSIWEEEESHLPGRLVFQAGHNHKSSLVL